MEHKIIIYLNSFVNKSAFLDGAVFFIAEIFPYIVIVMAAIFLFLHRDTFSFSADYLLRFSQKKKEGILIFFSGITAWFLASILKTILKFPRPFETIPELNPLLTPQDYSFPSGHATFFAVIAVSIFFYHKKAGAIFILSALLIGLARVMAGVHFPVDILAGLLFGTLMAFLMQFAIRPKSV